MIIGQYSPAIYFRISGLAAGISILLIYFINQYLQHDKPFPYTWISQVADHYPQFIFFRTSTISGCVLMALGWFTNHFYIKSVAMEHIVDIRKYRPQVILIIGLIGSMFLMGSTANIDTGKNNGKWHTFCASKFFITTVLAQLLNAGLYAKLHFKHNMFSKNLVYAKLFMGFLIILQLVIASQNGFFQIWGQKIDQNNPNDVKGIILEWTMTYTLLIGFLVMSMDVVNFKYVYEIIKRKNQEVLLQNQEQNGQTTF